MAAGTTTEMETKGQIVTEERLEQPNSSRTKWPDMGAAGQQPNRLQENWPEQTRRRRINGRDEGTTRNTSDRDNGDRPEAVGQRRRWSRIQRPRNGQRREHQTIAMEIHMTDEQALDKAGYKDNAEKKDADMQKIKGEKRNA